MGQSRQRLAITPIPPAVNTSEAAATQTCHRSEVRDLFADPATLEGARISGKVVARASCHDNGHGRIEERHITVTDHLDWLEAKERRSWLDLRCLVHVRSVRVKADGNRSEEDR